ncbi:flagellar hook-basal body complex protein [Butyrivibrio sp. NC2007]|uniref:flagellar hook-basal body complex protein n=1 Tax=Butyrivibrio sp. NC2007 TaxID=1280683 RepID=UPI0003B5FA78|nr:flagellar hook-basal body complex protein [Butyrivibrio sp. NC2007]
MMRSLYSGVAGLRTHQTKMDVLGNNIANVNTTSFKSQSITFSDLMYQTTQTASGATATKGGVNARQIGLGAKSGAIATAIESQGATQTTNNPFDIMITGKSFFVVNNGKENLYTRDGSFYVDGAGNLAMQSNGYLVQGWVAQEDKETGAITINRNGGLSSLQIMSADNTTYSPASTTAGLYSGNIDNRDTNVTSDDGKTITLEFYDNRGYLYTGKFTLKDTDLEDAENNNIFSLQLTDIIDSDGNSIGSDLLKGVSFGKTENFDYGVNEAYEVEVGATTSTVKLLAGATAYEGVPTTGTLSDLMESSKASYAGILKTVYGIDDATIAGGTQGYSKTSEYTITENGVLTITYDEELASGKPDGYTYSSTNASSYYVNKDNSGKAYVVPNANEGTMDKIGTAIKTTLTNVFGVNPTELDSYLTSKFQYKFTADGANNDSFQIYRDPAVTKATETATSVGYLSKFYEDFEGLEAAVDSYADTLFYTYTDGNLKVYGSKTDDTGTTQVTTSTQIADVTAFNEDEVYTYTMLDNAQKVALHDMLVGTGTGRIETKIATTATTITIDGSTTDYDTNSDGSLNDTEKAAYDAALQSAKISELADYMNADANKYTNFKIESLSGTAGVLFYKTNPTYIPDTANKLYDGSPFSKTFYADENTFPSYTAQELGGVYTNTTDFSAYVLKGDEATVNDFSDELFQDVFGLDRSEYATNLLVNIAGNGTASIYQTTTFTPPANSDYAASLDADGTLKYVTTNDTVAWDNLPNSSNDSVSVKDLLQSSSGPYRGLLNSVYGITDEVAEAFGSDATYSLNNDGSITLTTGTQSIQLKFNPANGSLTTANGNSNGLVNLVFDQNVEGLEPFGFQPTTADEEAERGRLTIDFSTVTNYNTSGSSTIKAVKGDKSSLNTGRMVGEMNGVNVSTDGQIFATYSNGQTKLLGQIASAEFANASGLAKEGDNLYSSTLNSGEATIQDITTDGGYMNTGVLEMSNVDLSREFTEMITTQRGFQANSRIITVSDTLLEELTNLKR